jgi:RimJ/RimL family protein N-acetyltransferase
VRRSTIFEFLDRRPVLAGDEVSLRPRTLDDCADEYAWRTDGELCRLDASTPLPMTLDEFRNRYSAELEFPGLTYTLAIDTRQSIHIGVVSLFNLDFMQGSAEVGIMIGEKATWDRGYGTDALKSLLDFAFEVSSLNSVSLRTLDWNLRAQRCFEKCGFSRYGALRRGEYSFVLMRTRRPDSPPVTQR